MVQPTFFCSSVFGDTEDFVEIRGHCVIRGHLCCWVVVDTILKIESKAGREVYRLWVPASGL